MRFERAARGEVDPAQEFVNTYKVVSPDENVEVNTYETIFVCAENAEIRDQIKESIQTNKVQDNPLKSKEPDRVAHKNQNKDSSLQNSTRLDISIQIAESSVFQTNPRFFGQKNPMSIIWITPGLTHPASKKLAETRLESVLTL